MKQILFEQLPPELFNLFDEMRREIAELNRKIEEGVINMAISEAEFNIVKERLGQLEQRVTDLSDLFDALSITPQTIADFETNISTNQNRLSALEANDLNMEQLLRSIANRLTAIEISELNLAIASMTLPNTVTDSISLLSVNNYGHSITWSSNSTYIEATGVVTQPTALEGDQDVILTAVVSRGSSSVTKTFTVTVLAAELTAQEKLDAIIGDVNLELLDGQIVDEYIIVSTNQTLPLTIGEATIVWQSTNPQAFSNDGVITRDEEDVELLLEATVRVNDASIIVPLRVIVAKEEEEVLPDFTEYYIGGFDVSTHENKIEMTVMYDGIYAEHVRNETVDGYVRVETEHAADEQIETEIGLNGNAIGTFTLSLDDLKEGVLLSTIFNRQPALLADEIHSGTHEWTFSFGELTFDANVELKYLINDVAVQSGIVTITGVSE